MTEIKIRLLFVYCQKRRKTSINGLDIAIIIQTKREKQHVIAL